MTGSSTDAPANGIYTTSRSMAALEQCLYDELSDLGDATYVRSDAETILMIRNGQGSPILVAITPPAVEITAGTSTDVRTRVRRCL